MAKISELPVLDNPTGAELVPVFSADRVTRRTAIGGLVAAATAPHLAAMDDAVSLALATSGARQILINRFLGISTTGIPGVRFVAFRALQPTTVVSVRAQVYGGSNYVLQRVRPTHRGGWVAVGARVNLFFQTGGKRTWTADDILAANGGVPFVVYPGEPSATIRHRTR